MKLFSFLCASLALTHTHAKYDDTIAKRNLQLAAATYCSADKIQSWDCTHCVPGITVRDAIIGTTNIIVANDSVQNATVFAFRGSADIQNWISNLEFIFTSPYLDRKIKVHEGFYEEYMEYKDALFQYLPPLGEKIIIAGHSSGAALSMLMAYDIYKLYDVEVYTFGKPRLGNDAFVESAKPIRHYRITHHNDIVPHLPEEVFGYRHTNTEIWYTGDDGKNYRICENNEDKECSNSCAPIHCDSIDDHLYYMGTHIGTPYC